MQIIEYLGSNLCSFVKVSLKFEVFKTVFFYYRDPTAAENPVDDVPHWPPYTASEEEYLRIDKEFQILRNFKNEFTISVQEGLPQPPRYPSTN